MGWEARQAGTCGPGPAPFPGLGGAWGLPHQVALVSKGSTTPRNFAASENLGRGQQGGFPGKGAGTPAGGQGRGGGGH